ncbi:MAG: ADP-forming succinate--CoA ligase subunit beta, partial [Polyangiales bacterium]
MNIHEYQAKDIYRRYGIAVPFGQPAFNVAEARKAAEAVCAHSGDETLVVKAQIHAGGRGKAGGVKVVKGVAAACEVAGSLFGKQLVTHQTGPGGQPVRRLLIEQGVQIDRELYLALVVDRKARRVAVMASTEGGVDIEEVAAKTPEKIVTRAIDPAVGLQGYQARQLAFGLGLEKKTAASFIKLLDAMTKLFVAEDCSLLEVNPLIVTATGEVMALDAKVNFDDNAAFRHPVWAEWRDTDEEEATEIEAQAAGLSYIKLDGNIGCLVNGAGLAMATM